MRGDLHIRQQSAGWSGYFVLNVSEKAAIHRKPQAMQEMLAMCQR